MLSKWPIRNKLLIGIVLLLVIVATLSASGFVGVYSYRSLVKSLSGRAVELPLATALGQQVSDLRVTLSETRQLRESPGVGVEEWFSDNQMLREEFREHFTAIQETLQKYQYQLDRARKDTPIGNNRAEQETAGKIAAALDRIAHVNRDEDWMLDEVRVGRLNDELEQLQLLAAQLPSNLHERIHDLSSDVRLRYRTWIVITWLTMLSAIALLAVFLQLFYRWIFRPLRVLIKGSRRVASGEFNYRIRLEAHDEMAELATAMNDMTSRFQAIRDDLDRQVQLRTKQVVRSEQLASVGFLAAGVAHEINNPLASIAMCAEALEGRMSDLIYSDDERYVVVRNYLQMIQNEAFRCKEITEKLLDFSRMGEVKRQFSDLRELIQGVIDMVRHLGKYQNRHIEFAPGQPLLASINAQEMKQVILNLITNGLDAVDSGGTLKIQLHHTGSQIEILFSDNGCGMTDDVLKHLFEPFFTRKRGSQGTGLGLSIVYRIVAEHDGQIEASSEGPGQGSQFRVTLPCGQPAKEKKHRYQAA